MAKRNQKKTPKCATAAQRPIRPRPETPNLILTLPPELRNEIYQLALLSPKRQFFFTKLGWEEPQLLQTCKQIRTEALPVYYANNDISLGLHLQPKQIEVPLKALKEIVLLGGPQPLRSLEIHLYGEIWQHLGEILPLLEFMRATGFEPATKQYQLAEVDQRTGVRNETGSSVFRMPRSSMGSAQFVLEKALSLARRARAEGWTAERLALRFQEYVAEQSKKRGKNTTIVVESKQL